MSNNSDSLLPSSLSKVESNSRLTININQTNLPLGPSLLPPSIIHPPVTLESKPNNCEQKNLPSTQIVDIPPPMPLPSIFSSSSSRPIGQMRSRYVLPPQLSQSPVPTLSETLPTPPIPTPSQPETSFSSMTVLPTPSFYNVSDPSESIQQPTDTTSSFSSATGISAPSAFNVSKPTKSEEQSTSALPTMTVLPTPSYYNLSGSSQSQQQEGRSGDEAVPQPVYEAPSAHWFYSTKTVNHGIIWWPFSLADTQKLENAATAANLLSTSQISANASNTAVPVRGGLYDVLLCDRVYKPCYWPADEEEAGEVCRVTWLYRPQNEQRVLPCSEAMCERLEENYRRVLEANSWGEQFLVTDENAPSGQCTCIFHNSKLMLQYHKESESASETYSDCAYLYRGLRDDLASQLPISDERPIKHVVFVVHGIGSIYNMRGEGLISCVNDMRKTASALLDSHFNKKPQLGRVEFLPVRWHSSLHSEEIGVNSRLKRVTLRSIPKLRSYTNETLTDILFYTSPKYCQHIVDTVANTIKQLRKLFLQRNPDYSGDFSVAGHSLGSVIVFDLLSHQRRTPSSTPSVKSTNGGADDDEWSLIDSNSNSSNVANSNADLINHLHMSTDLSEGQIRQVVNALVATNKTLEVGAQSAGVGLPVVNYPQLGFALNTCFLLGSPLSLFLIVRGVERLSSDFRLPTCQGCVNIFHPFDPVAYRLENLVMPEYRPCAVLMPHHAGRKRLHLELKDNIARVGADITSMFYQSLKSTWRSLQEFASAHTSSGISKSSEDDATSMSEEEKDSEAIKRVLSRLADNINAPKLGDDYDYDGEEEEVDQDSFPCQLNQGRRLDYVLQEAPLESLNDYLFALSSHAVYWDSRDCLLFMLNQIFDTADSVNIRGVTTPTNTDASLTPRGETNYGLLTATAPETSVMQHSASNPTFASNPIPGSAFHPAQHFYPPSGTSMFDPSPPLPTASLHSQGGAATDLIDLSNTSNRQTTADSNFVEIDLAP